MTLEQVLELISSMARSYSTRMEEWGESDRMANKNDVASAYGIMAFDLINLIHLAKGNVEQVQKNQEALGDSGIFVVDEMADYQAEPEEKEDEPFKWN